MKTAGITASLRILSASLAAHSAIGSDGPFLRDGARALTDHTDPMTIGGAGGEDGCLDGYAWCESVNACVRPREIRECVRRNDGEGCGPPTEEGVGSIRCDVLGACRKRWDLRGCLPRIADVGGEDIIIDIYPDNMIGGGDEGPGTPGTTMGGGGGGEEEGVEGEGEGKVTDTGGGGGGGGDEGPGTPGMTMTMGGGGGDEGEVMDEHGCFVDSGFGWCDVISACVQPWKVRRCIQADDSTGCNAAAGEVRCSWDENCFNKRDLRTCLPPPEGNAQPQPTTVGGDLDEYGCMKGYSWCASLNGCVETLTTPCPETTAGVSVTSVDFGSAGSSPSSGKKGSKSRSASQASASASMVISSTTQEVATSPMVVTCCKAAGPNRNYWRTILEYNECIDPVLPSPCDSYANDIASCSTLCGERKCEVWNEELGRVRCVSDEDIAQVSPPVTGEYHACHFLEAVSWNANHPADTSPGNFTMRYGDSMMDVVPTGTYYRAYRGTCIEACDLTGGILDIMCPLHTVGDPPAEVCRPRCVYFPDESGECRYDIDCPPDRE